jgi:branched-chain amino acid transport system permease protein
MTAGRLNYVIFGLWVLALASTPFWATNYIVRLAIMVAMYTSLTLSWNFIGGFTGYPSFSTAAFFGLGCYAGALSQRAGVPLVLAWTIATLFVGAFATALGGIILRLRGHYFAIGSIGVVEVVRLVVLSWPRLTGGGDGLNLPLMTGGPDAVARIFLIVMLAIMVIVFAVTVLVDRGRLGFGLRCIQQNEDAAIMLGIGTTRYKIAAFTLSAIFPGLSGGIYASWVNYIDPTDVYDVLLSVKPIVMVLLGGVGTVLGGIYGAVLFLLMEELVWRNLLQFHAGLLGIIVVALVLFLPQGLRGAGWARLSWRRPKPEPAA